MAWNYAELSKMAKENGGPEKLVELLIKAGEKAGESKALRRVGIGLAITAVTAAGIYKLVDYFTKKKAISDAEVEAAKKEIIQGINDYDAAHPDELSDDNGTENDSDVDDEEEPDSEDNLDNN